MPRVVTACPLDCPDSCSVAVEVDAGRLVGVAAAEGNPLTAGFVCQKVATRQVGRVYGPERVSVPLVRTGPKGTGSFRPVSWDEALDLVAARLLAARDEHGAASVLAYVYNSSAPALQSVLTERLLQRFGATYADHTLCAATKGKAWREMFGQMLSADPADVAHARLLVVWGANPAISNTHLPPIVRDARRGGTRVVVVDPRRTATARRADLHLAPRPGTDVVLALAVARHLAELGGLDEAFLAAHAEGVDELLTAAAPWTPARAAAVTGVEPGGIATLAELLRDLRPACFRVGWGLERNRNGGSSCVAVFALPALTGNFGAPGSGIVSDLGSGAPLDVAAVDPGTWARRLPMHRLGALLADQSLAPPIRALLVQGSNPAVTAPDQRSVLAGLARDDLFTVVHEQVFTDTAAFADVVLPAPSHFEYDDVVDSYGSYTLQRARAAIEPVGDSRTNNEVGALLADRLGFDPVDFDPDPGRLIAACVTHDGPVVRAPGATVQFRDTFPTTPSGRVRLAGIDEIGVPRYRSPDERYPLMLITPATHRTINSIFGESNAPEAAIRVHPDDAADRGLRDGDEVRVRNDLAELRVILRVDGDLRPGVASMPKGMWRRTFANGLTPNALMYASDADLACGATYNDARVEISAAD